MFTIADLKRLEAEGFIRGFTAPDVPKKGTQNAPQGKVKSKSKAWLALNLKVWAEAKGLELLTEYKFHPERKWRHDWYFPELKTAIEYEGLGLGNKSGHTTNSGYSDNAEKYSQAAIMGIKVLRYTYKNAKNALKDLETLINQQ